MSLRFRSGIARARVLRLLVEAGPNPELLLDEPGLAEFQEHISDLVTDLKSGESVEECLEPWIGEKSEFAGFAARHGCLDEWLLDTAAWLETRTARRHYCITCLNTFIQAAVPLSDSLPLIAKHLEDADTEAVSKMLADGQTFAEIAEYFNIYAEPLLTWLHHTERSVDFTGYHDYLVRQILGNELVWPLRSDQTVTYQLRSLLLLIDVGLVAGRSLDQIVSDIPHEIEAAPWWSKVRLAFGDSGSISDALAAQGMITPLAAALIEDAEQAGQLGPTLRHVVARFARGLLYPAETISRYRESGGSSGDNQAKAAADVGLDPDEIEAWLETISIRGRMAYALLCIESALVTWHVTAADVRAALAVFWEFTSSMRLDVWERESQVAQPYLYALHDDTDDDWDEMADDFGYAELPAAKQEALGRMLLYAHGISDNLYAGFQSHVTAIPLIEIINVMQIIGLPLPDRSRVSLSSVDESGGWGEPHPRHFYL